MCTCTTSYVHIETTAINGFVVVHDELLRECDLHVTREDDPKRLRLDGRPTQRPIFGRHRVIVAVIRHHVNRPILASGRILPKPNRTVRQPLPVLLPTAVAPPAIVNWVPRLAIRQSSTVRNFFVASPATPTNGLQTPAQSSCMAGFFTFQYGSRILTIPISRPCQVFVYENTKSGRLRQRCGRTHSHV